MSFPDWPSKSGPPSPRARCSQRSSSAADIEPIEINAGQWYLRGLRADGRIDDRPALADLGVTDPDYVERSAVQWSADTCYCWAVCDMTTGELLAEVTLDPATGQVATRARTGHRGAASTAAQAVSRFAAAIVVPQHNSGKSSLTRFSGKTLSDVVGAASPE